jgi:hypothetical protein
MKFLFLINVFFLAFHVHAQLSPPIHVFDSMRHSVYQAEDNQIYGVIDHFDYLYARHREAAQNPSVSFNRDEFEKEICEHLARKFQFKDSKEVLNSCKCSYDGWDFSPRGCYIDLTFFIPGPLRKITKEFSPNLSSTSASGPNCLNMSLIGAGVLGTNQLHYTNPKEYEVALKYGQCEIVKNVKSDEDLKFGDIISIYHSDGKIYHALNYISSAIRLVKMNRTSAISAIFAYGSALNSDQWYSFERASYGFKRDCILPNLKMPRKLKINCDRFAIIYRCKASLQNELTKRILALRNEESRLIFIDLIQRLTSIETKISDAILDESLKYSVFDTEGEVRQSFDIIKNKIHQLASGQGHKKAEQEVLEIFHAKISTLEEQLSSKIYFGYPDY